MILTSRRRFLTTTAAAAAIPVLAHAADQKALLLEPITASSGQGTPYSRFSNQGPYGHPLQSVQITPTKGLRLNVYVPPGRTSGRVVIFSHAELVLPDVYDNLLGHWASHGFIVIAPLHDDSILVNGLKAHHESTSGATWDLGSVIDDTTSWSARARTCKEILDILPMLQQSSGIHFIDDRPIIVGHSFGAFAAQLLLGARAWKADGTVLNEKDPRFYAGILLSPQGRGVLGLKDGSWDYMDRPFLAASGNGDYGATGQDPNTRIEPFSLAPPGHKHLAWFSHILPTLYTGQQIRAGTQQEVVFEDVLAVTTAALYAYGNYDKTAFDELAGDYFTKATDQRVTMFYR